MNWPPNPFWDYALELYRKEGVEGACLELQARHGLDVNLVLLCCWLASRGIEADARWLNRAGAAVDGWRSEVIHPLRGVRDHLKAALATRPADGIPGRWPELAAGLRGRVLASEIDAERIEQLLLAELATDLVAGAPPGIAIASRNLRALGRFTRADRQALRTVLAAAFLDPAHGEPDDHLGWLGP